MDLQHIPLRNLKVSKLNMRHARKAPDISDILPTIRAHGVQQPLLVRPNGKGYEIIAGRRRFFALKALAKESGEAPEVPCAVMAPGDDTAALEASLIENTARLDPDEVSRWETFARLVAQGRSAEDIAVTFGVSEIMVRRALALGNLLPEIREAYRAEEIDPQTIRHLTLASPDKQAEWFRLFTDPESHAPRGPLVKRWLFGAPISTDAALFPLEQYTGSIVTDLFGEGGYFEDAGAFWDLQNVAIAAKREALLAEGWAAVTILETGERFWSWEHVPVPKDEGGHVFIELFESGEVNIHEGYLSEKAYRKRLRQSEGGDEVDQDVTPDRPELTKAAQTYLHLHRHAAVRHALLSHPGAALRLMVAHVIVGSSLWRVEPEPQRADKEATAASLKASKAEAAFAEERKAVLALLGLPEDSASVVRNNTDDVRLVGLFAALLKLSDKQVMRILAFVMAETLEAGTGTVEALGKHLAVDMQDYWQPDAAFFDLLRDKGAINAMLADIGGHEVAEGNLTATAKVQKTIIGDFVTGQGRTKVEGWLPGYMEFPFRSYTQGGGGTLSANTARIAGLLE